MFSQLLLFSMLAPAVMAQDIVWKSSCPADVESTFPIVCGSLSVPLDYTDVHSNQTLDLQLYKIPVGNGTKSEHSVLLNFGGPGNDGLAQFTGNASALRLLLGGDRDHDLILITPRANPGSNLNFSCSQNPTQGALQYSWTSLSGNASDVAPGEIWATTGLYADACRISPTATNGDLIGTEFVARDFMQVAEALHEDGLIYYQGFSYGSVLGMTIASLFPDKIGRMVLDGNVRAYDYYQGSYEHYYPEGDEVFSLFCSTCVQTPHLCALAHNQSSADLEHQLLAFFEDLKYHPLPVNFSDGLGGLVDYSFVTSAFYDDQYLYMPTSWPNLSILLADLLTGNTTLIQETEFFQPAGPDTISGIRCGDSRVRTSDPTSLDSVINATEAKSPIFGSLSVPLYYTCAQWPFQAKGNFSWPAGNVTIPTKKPALLIGNLHDPITPFANAEFNSAALEGSVVLQHDGVGHTTFFTQGSLCTARALRAYWVNGTLPRPGTSCEIDVPVFSNDNGWETVLKQLAQENGETYHP